MPFECNGNVWVVPFTPGFDHERGRRVRQTFWREAERQGQIDLMEASDPEDDFQRIDFERALRFAGCMNNPSLESNAIARAFNFEMHAFAYVSYLPPCGGMYDIIAARSRLGLVRLVTKNGTISIISHPPPTFARSNTPTGRYRDQRQRRQRLHIDKKTLKRAQGHHLTHYKNRNYHHHAH